MAKSQRTVVMDKSSSSETAMPLINVHHKCFLSCHCTISWLTHKLRSNYFCKYYLNVIVWFFFCI
jgi:hypothetical protein